MPYLDIGEDVLSTVKGETITYIVGVMLWPRNTASRADFITFIKAQTYTNKIEDILGAMPGASLSPVTAIQLARLNADAPRLGDIQQAAEACRLSAMIAGRVLSETLGWVQLNRDKARVTRVISSLSKRVDKSVATVNNIWRDFKSVAHLWAACRDQGPSPDLTIPFPCGPDEIARFLAISEMFAEAGESLKPQGGTSVSLLPKGTCWRVPAGIASRLPRESLTFIRQSSIAD
jgi:hypothetical protein